MRHIKPSLLLYIFIISHFCVSAQQHDNPVALMPLPQTLVYDNGKLRIGQDFSIAIPEGADKRLYEYANRFLRRIDGRSGIFFIQGIISETHPQRPAFPILQVNVLRKANWEIGENESYKISIKPDKIILDAETELGVMHGFETLSQLLSNDEIGYYFPVVEISDAPRFSWRALMIDVAHHFMPVNVIKRNIDAMAMVKLNILHLHLSDDQGWRVESKLFPKLHLNASDGQYYTQSQIKEIVAYAYERGIKLVPEINLPSRASAILYAYPELSAVIQSQELKRISGNHHSMLNIASEKTYDFLDKLIPEISNLFQDKYIHIGGDVSNFQMFMHGNQYADFLKKNNIHTSKDLQIYFINRLLKTVKKTNKKLIGWDDLFTENMDKAVIMQSKNDKESIYNIAIKGNPVVLSFGYELDQLYPARTLYSNDPLPPFEVHTDKEKKNSITSLQERNILGGELLMWTDLVSSNSIDSRIWPRAAAVAERLWSAQNMLDEQDMYKRLDKINLLLQEANLTHLSNSNAILSQVSGQHDINALKVLVNVIEPYKGNLRNQGMQLYKTYSPYSLITDAAVVDAYDARQFRNFVNSYNHTRSASDKAEIDKYLRLWRENHNEFLRISYGVPTLRYLIKMSENLSLLANVGLDALKHIETKINVQKSWYESNLLVINTIRRYQEANMSNPQSLNDARCELAIIDDILLLLDLTNPDLAKKRQHDEAQLKGKN